MIVTPIFFFAFKYCILSLTYDFCMLYIVFLCLFLLPTFSSPHRCTAHCASLLRPESLRSFVQLSGHDMFGLQAASQPKFTDSGLLGNNNNSGPLRMTTKTAYHQGLMNTHKDFSQWRKENAPTQERVIPVNFGFVFYILWSLLANLYRTKQLS